MQRYDQAFGALAELQVPTVWPEVESAWHLYVVRLHLGRLNIDRAQFIEALKALNIGASVHFIPNHIHSYYRDKYGFYPTDFPVAFEEYQRLMTLPLYPRMSDRDVTDVIEAVTTVVADHRT